MKKTILLLIVAALLVSACESQAAVPIDTESIEPTATPISEDAKKEAEDKIANTLINENHADVVDVRDGLAESNYSTTLEMQRSLIGKTILVTFYDWDVAEEDKKLHLTMDSFDAVYDLLISEQQYEKMLPVKSIQTESYLDCTGIAIINVQQVEPLKFTAEGYPTSEDEAEIEIYRSDLDFTVTGSLVSVAFMNPDTLKKID